MTHSSTRRLLWAVQRLRAMTPAEALWRTRRALDAAGERARHRWRRPRRPELDEVVEPGGNRELLLFGDPRAFRPFLPEEGAGRQELAQALAATALPLTRRTGEATFETRLLGDAIELGAAVDWNRDPVSGRAFPLAHWSAIDHRDPADEAAIRRIWYLNRHLMLPELALDYHLSGDASAAELVCQLLDGWIAQSPRGSGVNWMVPLELGLRLWSWAWAARLLARSAALRHTAARLAISVHEQAEWILRHLASHSSANNHLLAQALGLLAAGVGFSGLRRAPAWRAVGQRILFAELERQTHPDGVSREQSRHYHELVLEIYLAAWLLLARGAEPPPAHIRDRLEGMLRFLADLEHLPPPAAAIGDSDDQDMLPFAGQEEPPARTLLTIGAVLYGRGDWLRDRGGLTRSAAVLLGAAGRERLAVLDEPRAPRRSRSYPDGGYTLLSDDAGSRALLLDHGPLGFLSTAAHGHADCLAITLGAFGEPMLIDPGTFSYHAEPRLRDYFRSTAAHNTLRVDGAEQSEMRGPFLWGRRATGRRTAWSQTAAVDLVAGTHDGYATLRQPVAHHRRVIFVRPDYFWVTDRLEGTGEHHVEQFFHFPACSLNHGSRSPRALSEVTATYASGAVLGLYRVGDALDDADILVGVEEPLQGWRSPRFGVREPAPVLRLSGRRRLPVALHTVLRPLPESPAAGASPTVRVEALDGATVLLAGGMPGTDLCLVTRDGTSARGTLDGAPGITGACGLDGLLGLVRWRGDAAGDPVSLAGVAARRLEVGGRCLFECETGVLTFAFRRLGDQAVWSGGGTGRIRLWAPGLAGVRREGHALLPVRDTGGWVTLELDRTGP
ncbi:MAG: alginate lyase family protein [Candidatus Eiseniibacteriota bacterium]|jgi:hypothetical protein